MSNFVINESDIFKYVVAEQENLEIASTVTNGRKLLQRIPINIFEDEYFALYECLKNLSMYDRAFSYDSIQQVLYNNKDFILSSDKMTILEDISDETERFESIVQIVLTEYNDLCELDTPDFTFSGNMELYIKSWADFKYEELIFNVKQILDNGVKYGTKTYKGREDADYIYKRTISIVNAIVEADANLLAESIDTSYQTPEQIEEIHNKNEATQETIGYIGVESIDNEMLGIRKGELITIQAGSGVGKTRFATSIASNILSNNKNVLVISLEQKPSRVFAMYQAREILNSRNISTISDKDIIRESYPIQYETIVREARENIVSNQRLGRLRIEGRYIKAKDILMELDTIWEDFKFDAVVIDYFGLLGIEKDRYNELTEAINLLKSICKSFKGEGFALIIPNQLSTTAEKDLINEKFEEAGIGGSESAYLFRGSDVVLTLHSTEEMQEDEEMLIFISKMRLGTKIPKVKVKTKLGQCLFTEIDESDDDEDNPFQQ